MGWQVVYVPFLEAGGTIINQQGLFVYSGTPTTGNLIASIASVAGVDNFGNAYEAGMTEYLPESGKIFAVGLNTLSGTGLPGLSIQDIANPPTSPAGFFGESSGNVSTPQAFAAITSGQANATDVATFISILSQVQSAVTGGQIVIQAADIQFDINGTTVDFVLAASDYPQYKLNTPNPPGGFNFGHFETSAAANQAINSLTAQQVTGSNIAVDATSYRIVWEIFYTGNQAAGTPSVAIALTGGATVGFAIGEFKFWQSGGVITRLNPTTGTFTNNQLGPTLVAAEAHMTIEAWVTFSAAGVILINAAEGVNGDSWVVNVCLTRVEKRQ